MIQQSKLELSCRAAFHPVISVVMTRPFCQPWEMASFAAGIAGRWELHNAGRRAAASMAFRKAHRAGGPVLTFHLFLRQAYRLLRHPPIQLAFFSNLSLVMARMETHSPHPATAGAPSTFFRTLEKTRSQSGGILRILEKTFGRDRYVVNHLGNIIPAPLAFLLPPVRKQKGGLIEREPHPGGPASRSRGFERGDVIRFVSQSWLALQTMLQRPLTLIQSSLTEFRSKVRNSMLTRDQAASLLRNPRQTEVANQNGLGHSLRLSLATIVRNEAPNQNGPWHSLRLSLTTIVRGEVREAYAASIRRPPPAPMVHARPKRPGMEGISTLLQDVQKSINNIPLAAPATPEVNIPQLTRQVYDQLERELRIEKERRGR